jgi:hypothetical protein
MKNLLRLYYEKTLLLKAVIFRDDYRAIDIIDEIPLTEKQIVEIQKILVDYDRSKFEYDHNVKGFEELVDLVNKS